MGQMSTRSVSGIDLAVFLSGLAPAKLSLSFRNRGASLEHLVGWSTQIDVVHRRNKRLYGAQ